MSEFECKRGHLMGSRDRFCPICAEDGFPYEGIYTMDGLTGSQWRKRERWEEEQAQRDDKEVEDDQP